MLCNSNMAGLGCHMEWLPLVLADRAASLRPTARQMLHNRDVAGLNGVMEGPLAFPPGRAGLRTSAGQVLRNGQVTNGDGYMEWLDTLISS